MISLDEKIAELVDFAYEQGYPQYVYLNNDKDKPLKSVFYSGPFFDKSETIAALKTFIKGRWLVSGEAVQKFQQNFEKMFDVKNSHMVNSGSSANLVMMSALKKHMGWADGDEIIVSPVGFPTTIAPIVQVGLKPVFIDIEFNTLNFDTTKIEEQITPRTRGIIVSPVLGNPPDMDQIQAICQSHSLTLIGDSCDSLGTRWNGKHLSELYKVWSCSFYPAHHISTGEGGMVSSNDSELIDVARSIAWWGRDCYCVGAANLLSCGTCRKRFDKWLDGYDGVIDHKYYFTNMGYNLKPLDLQGAIGIEQLKKFDVIEERRRANKLRFEGLLLEYVKGIRITETLAKADPSWFGVPIVAATQALKEKLQQFLEESGVQTRNYFAGNILLHPGYRHLGDAKEFPLANLALSHVFFVGCPPHYDDRAFEFIEGVLKKWGDTQCESA